MSHSTPGISQLRVTPPILLFSLLFFAGAHPLQAQDSKENADFKLAINLYNDGLYDLASEQLRQFIGSYPSTAQGIDARFYLGLTQMKLKKFEEARLTFQTFALTYQDNPKAPEAWWNVGESYAAVRLFKEAALAFERVKVFHPKSKIAPDALLKSSRYFFLAGERDDARKTLRVILQEYPNSDAVLSARTQLGQIYFEEGNYEQAQGELKRVIEGDPSPDARAGALLILGNISQATGRTQSAQASYRDIITKYPKSSAVQGAYANLAALLATAGKWTEAQEYYRKALSERTSPDSAVIREALIGSGDTQSALGDNVAAVATYERFLTSYPQDERTAEVLWKLACAGARGKNYKKSNDACTQILKSNAPDLAKRRAQLKLALNAQDQRNYPLALQAYDSFVEAYPDDPVSPQILLRTARITDSVMADSRKAAALYEQIVLRYGASPEADDALDGAARAHESLKEFDRALQLDHELIARYPSSEFRAAAESRIRMIQTFEAKEKDAGLEKLALLVGDVVSAQDRGGIPYRLGEIYFTDLKSYAAAATQFARALQGSLSDSETVDALLKRAQSLEYLSWKDKGGSPAAIEAYRAYLAHAGADSNAAELAIFRLSATSLPAARQTAAAIAQERPAFTRGDIIDLTLGDFLEKSDSLSSAASMFDEAARTARESAIAEEAAYRLLDILLRQNLADSAFSQGARFLSAFPPGAHSAEILGRLGMLALSAHKPALAVDLLQNLTGDFSYTTFAAGARQALGAALAAEGDTAAAISAYTDIYRSQLTNPLTDGETDPELLVALGELQQGTGNDAEAKRVLMAALRRTHSGPIAAQAYTSLGMIYRSEGLLDAATSYFRQAESAAPGVSVTRDIADLLYESGNFADAVTEYTELGAAAATDSERQYYDEHVILSLYRNDDAADADKHIGAFAKRYPDAKSALAEFELERGLSLFRREDYPAAMKAFRHVSEAFAESPSGPTATYWIGKTLEATEKPKEAIELLEHLSAENPQAPVIPRVHLALGNLYYNVENWAEAIKQYRLIVDDPHADATLLPSAMSNLIETYEVAGAYDGALTLTRKYLELYPNADDALDKKIKIGILYNHLGYYDQAVLQLQGLIDEAGSDLEGEIRYYIAEANYNKGDFQQAILDFLKVPYLVTKKGKIDWTANSLYMSGQSYEKMGRYDQALTMYQQIVDRTGIDETFKSAARKEIDRVKTVLKRKVD